MTLCHGLSLGKKQVTILTPSPLFLTRRLWEPSQRLTSLEMCQLALSQMRSITFLPSSSSFSVHHPKNSVVMELTGRPSTNLIHASSNLRTMAVLSSDSPIHRISRAQPANSFEIHPKFIRNSSAKVFLEQLWRESEVGKEEK